MIAIARTGGDRFCLSRVEQFNPYLQPLGVHWPPPHVTADTTIYSLCEATCLRLYGVRESNCTLVDAPHAPPQSPTLPPSPAAPPQWPPSPLRPPPLRPPPAPPGTPPQPPPRPPAQPRQTVTSLAELRAALTSSSGHAPLALHLSPRYALHLEGSELTIRAGLLVRLSGDASLRVRPTIDAGGLSRLFRLEPRASLVLSHVHLRGGYEVEGGAVWMGAQSELQMMDVHISACQARDAQHLRATRGGAVFVGAGARLSIDESHFTDCNVTQPSADPPAFQDASGGALYLWQHASATLTRTTISGCAAVCKWCSARAGAVYVSTGAMLTMHECQVRGARVAADMILAEGGALYLEGASAVLSDTNVTGTVCEGGQNVRGGVLAVFRVGRVVLSNCSIEDTMSTGTNASLSGGVVFLEHAGSSLHMSDSHILRTSAVVFDGSRAGHNLDRVGMDGGAMRLGASTVTEITRSVIADTLGQDTVCAVEGGAIRVKQDATLTMSSSQLLRSTALVNREGWTWRGKKCPGAHGGGINSRYATVRLTDVLIADCLASTMGGREKVSQARGGALYMQGGQAEFHNVEITRCRASATDDASFGGAVGMVSGRLVMDLGTLLVPLSAFHAHDSFPSHARMGLPMLSCPDSLAHHLPILLARAAL